MPVISESNKNHLISLKYKYIALPWYKKTLFPTALRNALLAFDESDSTTEQAWRVCDAYLNKTQSYQRLNLLSIRDFSVTAFSISLMTLRDVGLLNQANFHAIAGCQRPKYLARILQKLQRAKLLSGPLAKVNFNIVVGHQNLKYVDDILYMIGCRHLLAEPVAQDNFNTTVTHEHPLFLDYALRNYYKNGLLSGPQAQANFNIIARHQNADDAAKTLYVLYKAGLLNGEVGAANRADVARHQHLYDLAIVLINFSYAGLLSGPQAQANFSVLITYSTIFFEGQAAGCFSKLPSSLLSPEVFQRMVEIAQDLGSARTSRQAAIRHFVNTMLREAAESYGLRSASLELSNAELGFLIASHHPQLSMEEMTQLEDDQSPDIKVQVDAYKYLHNRLEVEDCPILYYRPEKNKTLLLVKLYQHGAQWLPVPHSSYIFDDTSLRKCVARKGFNPMTLESITKPDQYEGYRTRYRAYPYYPSPNARSGISQELSEMAKALRAHLAIRAIVVMNEDIPLMPVTTQALQCCGIYKPVAINNNEMDNPNACHF